MNAKLTRKIVRIDEAKCDGCGECIPNCHEGAIKLINGKAKLVADNLCDGLGACLGKCPRDAITIEERPAEGFDEEAVKAHLQGGAKAVAAAVEPPHAHQAGGCPGSRLRMFTPAGEGLKAKGEQGGRPSRLRQWPVQLALVPVAGPLWQDADVLIAADCVAFAAPEFHETLLAGKTLAIACPKLDDMQPYVEKLARIFAGNAIRSITVAHMEVPCCSGIVRAVHMALAQAGRGDLAVRDITVKIDGGTVG